jgi:hypothetical protein
MHVEERGLKTIGEGSLLELFVTNGMLEHVSTWSLLETPCTNQRGVGRIASRIREKNMGIYLR